MVRSHQEDIEFWLGLIDGEETEASDDPMLPHLTDQEILGLCDSYDDPRINVIVRSYIKLRHLSKVRAW